jgi:hypothetical protein
MTVSSFLVRTTGLFKIRRLLQFLTALIYCAFCLTTAKLFAEPIKRQAAPRPENIPSSEIIEPDAFRLLVGPKPNFTVLPQSKAPTGIKKTTYGTAWSQLISGSTLGDEIKAAMPRLQKMVATKTFFDSHIDDAVDEFRMLSVYFEIISEFDKEGEVRSSWKKNAVGYRDRFQQSAHRCERAGGNPYVTAGTSVGDLENLIRGEPNDFSGGEEKDFEWSQLCDRSLLMRRLKIANTQLTAGTASETSFLESTDQLFYASEIIACFGELLVQPNFIDWDDVDYKGFSYNMKEMAVQAKTAIIEGNYDLARKAAKSISQACSACHADFR